MQGESVNVDYRMDDTLMIFGVVCIVVLLGFILYTLLKKRMDKQKEYNRAKTKIKVDLNAETSKSIIDYLDTLKVVQGTDLTNLETSLKDFITEKIAVEAAKIAENKDNIKSNKDNITINKLARKNNTDRLTKIEGDVEFLRKGIKYDNTKIIMKFISEFERKYTLISSERDMLLESNMLYILDDRVFKFFDNNYDKPDIFFEDNKNSLMSNIHTLLRQFNFMNYYDNLTKLNRSCYNSDIPYMLDYISLHKNDINFTNKIDFIFNNYIPKLLNYIINNQINIYTDIDSIMLSYYKDVPDVEFFNQYMTDIEMNSIINNDTHLFTKMMIHTTSSLYDSWTQFKTSEFDTMFNQYEKKLLFVLLPEYLISMKYNTDYTNKYNKYIDSNYFLNMPSGYLNTSNIVKFQKIISMFACDNDESNILNDSLKIFLSDQLSTLCTSKHQQFINIFLTRFNTVISSNPILFDNVDNYTLEYKDFVCDAPDNFNIEAHCSTIVS